MLVVAIVLAAASLLVGKSSKLIASWRNPSYAPAKKFHRVLAMGFSNKMEVRADFEDALAAELMGLKPAELKTVAAGEAAGLGQMDYRKLALRELEVT